MSEGGLDFDSGILFLEGNPRGSIIARQIDIKFASSTTTNPYFQKDILQNIVKFCDFEALAFLSRTCTYFYHFICKSDNTLKKLLIEDTIQNAEEKLKSKIRSNPRLAKNTTLNLPMEIISDQNFFGIFFKETLKYNLQNESKVLDANTSVEADSLFKLQIKRMGNFLTTRVFSLPISITSMRAKGYNISDLIKETLDNFVGGVAGENTNKWKSDAFSYTDLSLKKLTPLKKFEEIEVALKSDYSKFQMKSRVSCDVPDAQKFVKLLKNILGSKRILIFQDIPFRPTGLSGLRFVAFGNKYGCIFQYEICSSICGGPYSVFSCGMG